MSEIKSKKRFNNENKKEDKYRIFDSISINKDKHIFNIKNWNNKIFNNNMTNSTKSKGQNWT